MRQHWRFLRYLKNLVKCWAFHKTNHADVQWEMWKMGSMEDVGNDGAIIRFEPHFWRVWTGCSKCGMGWTHTVEQRPSGIDALSRNQPLSQIPDASFHTPSGGTDARKEAR